MKLQLSKHLFWDVDPDALDEERSKGLIISRVLSYGLIDDWRQVKEYYGIDAIAQVASGIRDLDGRSVAFISLLSNIPKGRFRSESTRVASAKHWV